MSTTGTTSFDLDVNEIVEEAFARCDTELRTGYHLSTARRSLNLLTLDWANRGINIWTIAEGSIPLVKDTIEYDLPADTIDLLEHQVRTGSGSNQSDITISRISVSTYASIPNKNATGRPIQIFIDRQVSPKIKVWPAPDQSNTYTLVYFRMRKIHDAGDGVETQDVPARMLPCLVAGLSYYLALKLPNAAPKLPFLKQEYEEQWMIASSEDREKAPLRLAPREFLY